MAVDQNRKLSIKMKKVVHFRLISLIEIAEERHLRSDIDNIVGIRQQCQESFEHFLTKPNTFLLRPLFNLNASNQLDRKKKLFENDQIIIINELN